jgi:hypothetical protein
VRPALIGIAIAAWFLIVGESYVFFGVIIPVGPPIHNIGVFTAVAILKLLLTLGLGLLWFFAIVSLTELYARSMAKRLPPTSSS